MIAARFDFFIVSQSVRQGTVNPTCYDVIYDETRMPVNIVQQLTYKLCHLYYNWPVCGLILARFIIDYENCLVFDEVGHVYESFEYTDAEQPVYLFFIHKICCRRCKKTTNVK